MHGMKSLFSLRVKCIEANSWSEIIRVKCKELTHRSPAPLYSYPRKDCLVLAAKQPILYMASLFCYNYLCLRKSKSEDNAKQISKKAF